MNTAAFFDVDGTLFRDQLVILLAERMKDEGLYDKDIWYNELGKPYRDWKRRKEGFESYLDEFSHHFEKQLKGQKHDALKALAKDVVNYYGDNVFVYTKDRIKYHKDTGDLVFFISGSPDFVIEEVAKKYGVTGYAASTLPTKEGIHTGEYHSLTKTRKSEVIDKLVRKHNIDLDKSFGYGDTEGDYSMLSKVGNPICVNPNKKLYDMILGEPELKQRTQIVVERKDMVYEIGN